MSLDYKDRANFNPDLVWGWLFYAVGVFTIGVGLSYCTIQVLETAEKIAG